MANEKNLSKGYHLCYQGAKLVLFVTRRYPRTYWACLLSEECKDQDVIIANDHKVTSPGETIEEAEIIDGLGTGVTGGEPLFEIECVVEYCTAFKKHFGPEHHIHLDAGNAPLGEELVMIAPCIDELRMPPPHGEWAVIMDSLYIQSTETARKRGLDVGIDVPLSWGLRHFFSLLDRMDFFNINQLEWGDANADVMCLRKLELITPLCNAIQGLTKWAGEINGHPKVHYCTSIFKDSVLLLERLKRLSHNSVRPFDIITNDGTIMYGLMNPGNGLEMILSLMRPGCTYAEMDNGTIELDWQQICKIPAKFDINRKIIERYPNNGMTVEVIPR